MTRRTALKMTVLGLAAALVPRVRAQTTDREWNALGRGEIPFALPPLPYAPDALEPFIDARTVEVHHDKIHATYVKNLNKTIADVPQLYIDWKYQNITADPSSKANRWLEELLRNLDSVPEKIRASVRNNGAGHYNHSLFWRMLKKGGGGGPKGELAEVLNKTFGGLAGFKAALTRAALGQFGSGWAWLTAESGRLRIEALPDEDTPLSLGRQVLLGIDLWEHAYYLKYQNQRADYIAAWLNVVNWDYVGERYAKLKG